MASDAADNPAAPNGHIPTILVVEDETYIRFYVADSLRDHGFRVLEAANGSQALRMLDGDQPVDLVFTDVRMPGDLDGFELAQRLRSHTPRVPVILTSGHRNEPAAREICPDNLFLPKPYEISELVSCIRRLLAHPERPDAPSD